MIHYNCKPLIAGARFFRVTPGLATVQRWNRIARLSTGPPVCRASRRSDGDDDNDDDDGEAPVAGKLLRSERLLANLGYGKRRECQMLVKRGRLTRRDGTKLKVGEKVCWGDVVLDGEELDPPSPLLVMLHKPTGYVVTAPDDENISDPVVYDLLPYRFGRRRPFLSSVGRLDKDTSGLLLLTDDGTLLHRINSPRRGIWKVYEATLADPMSPKQAEVAARKFASGSVVLEGDYTPLLPAKLELLGERLARVAICEGRYHQVRRMFAAVGNKVVALHRVSVGGLTLGSLPEAEWRYLEPEELELVFSGPTAEEVLGSTTTLTATANTPRESAPQGAQAAAGEDAARVDDAGSAAERDGGSSASSSGGGGRGEKLTKKEKKKGRKERRGSRIVELCVGEEDEDEANGEGEEEDVDDVELLLFEEGEASRRATQRSSMKGQGGVGDEEEEEGEEWERPRGGRGQGRRARRPPRPPTVRQGAVLDRAVDGWNEELDASAYGNGDDEATVAVVSAGAGPQVKKYRDGAKWQRRREALRELLPP